MTPSELPRAQWAKRTDTQLAKEHGGTRARWSGARKRLGMPKSPAGHGGKRPGAGTHKEKGKGKATLLLQLGKLSAAQLQKMLKATG